MTSTILQSLFRTRVRERSYKTPAIYAGDDSQNPVKCRAGATFVRASARLSRASGERPGMSNRQAMPLRTVAHAVLRC